MQRDWSENKLEYFWALLSEEKALLGNKKGKKKFLYLLLLKYYSIDYSFPCAATDIPREIIDFGMKQYSVRVTMADIEVFLNSYDSYVKYQREIRNHYGVNIYSEVDHKFIKAHIYKVVLSQ